MTIGLIIPISMSDGQKFRLHRLAKLLDQYRGGPFDLWVVDGTKSRALRKSVQRLTEVSSAKYFYSLQQDICSPGVLRNIGAAHATAEFVFFHDIDLWMSRELFQDLPNIADSLARTGSSAFAMFPCFYLNKEVSRDDSRRDLSTKYWVDGFLRREQLGIVRLALSTSCILVDRKHFLSVGGFDEQFRGYGCEDLELLHRLCEHYPIGPKPRDYAIDFRADVVAEQKGFRAYFAQYSLPWMFAYNVLFHAWHPRRLSEPYYKARVSNDAYFHRILNSSKGPWTDFNMSSYISRLLVENAYSQADASGLWLRTTEISTHWDHFWRKYRKFTSDPHQFLADAKIKFWRKGDI